MKVSLNDFPKVTCILRGYSLDEVDRILSVLLKSKIKSVEITYNSPDASNIIRYAVQKYSDKICFGAGTVTSMAALEDVVEAGVDFVLSPTTFTPEMLAYCKANNVISVPGAFSPSEVTEQFENGADIVKIFPAVVVSPIYFKQLSGPLGHLPLMAVGGVNAKNAADYVEAGADYLGIGSGMFNKQDVKEGNLIAMENSIKEFERALNL